MIKKISAIVLALVLCLSVVVVPVSAVELGDAKQAFEVKFDKEYYSAGDTAVVSVYVKAAEGYEIGASYLTIGLNSAVFPQGENSTTDIKASLVTNGVGSTHFKDPATFSTVQWATSGQVSGMTSSNTADENALYDQYIRISLNKNTEDGTGTKNGFPAAELNNDEDPIIQFELDVATGLADGTAINAAVTTGSISKGLSYIGYYSAPGSSTQTKKFTVADSTTVAATATIGAATPTYTVTYKDGDTVLEKFADVEEGKPTPTISDPTKDGFFFKGWSPAVAETVTADATYVAEWIPALTIAKDKTQINFDVDGNKLYEGTFAIRQFVEFDNLLDVFGTAAEATNGADGTGLTEIGFVYATTDSYKKADALAVIDAGASSGAYTLDNDAYISTTSKANSFVMGYTVNNIADASVSLTILAYAKYVVNGEEAIATIEIAGDYSDIYSTYESKIPPVNPEA